MTKRLGRIAHTDARDHQHLMSAHLTAAPLPVKKIWTLSTLHLDQGATGTCVGHGWCNFLRCAPIRTKAGEHEAYQIYKKAVLLDPWKTNDNEALLPDADEGLESGTTVRAGAQAVMALHELSSYKWAFTLADVVKWVLTKGPVVLGTNWYSSMFTPNASGRAVIEPTATIEGGHCYLLRGANTSNELGICTNSWGNDWNRNGDFTISFKDLERLILEGGEACTAIQSS